MFGQSGDRRIESREEDEARQKENIRIWKEGGKGWEEVQRETLKDAAPDKIWGKSLRRCLPTARYSDDPPSPASHS